MPYLITKAILGFPGQIEVSPDRYAQVVGSKKVLVRMVSIEEKFGMLVENYAEYERTLLELTLSRMLDVDYEYAVVHDARHLVNRRLANLMTAARMYVDQVSRDVKAVCNAAASEEATAARSAQYDSRLGYRVMEALRNHVQHHGLPVHYMSLPSSRIERPNAPRLVRHGLIVGLDVSRLQEDGGFKASVLAELLAKKGRKVALTPLVREYIEGLATAHNVVRESTRPAASAAEAVLAQVMDEARTAWGDIVGLCVAEEHENGELVERHDIFPELAKRWKTLAYRTRLLTSVSRVYVTSEPLEF